MARPQNQNPTATISIAATGQVKSLLEVIIKSGLYGKSVSEAAERLLTEAIHEMLNTHPTLSTHLQKRLNKLMKDSGEPAPETE